MGVKAQLRTRKARKTRVKKMASSALKRRK